MYRFVIYIAIHAGKIVGRDVSGDAKSFGDLYIRDERTASVDLQPVPVRMAPLLVAAECRIGLVYVFQPVIVALMGGIFEVGVVEAVPAGSRLRVIRIHPRSLESECPDRSEIPVRYVDHRIGLVGYDEVAVLGQVVYGSEQVLQTRMVLRIVVRKSADRAGCARFRVDFHQNMGVAEVVGAVFDGVRIGRFGVDVVIEFAVARSQNLGEGSVGAGIFQRGVFGRNSYLLSLRGTEIFADVVIVGASQNQQFPVSDGGC